MIPEETGKEGSETGQGTHLSSLVLPLSTAQGQAVRTSALYPPLPPCLGICVLGPSMSMSLEIACQPHNCATASLPGSH